MMRPRVGKRLAYLSTNIWINYLSVCIFVVLAQHVHITKDSAGVIRDIGATNHAVFVYFLHSGRATITIDIALICYYWSWGYKENGYIRVSVIIHSYENVFKNYF